ncbi:hypothetical protein KDJ07_gp60 [Arthrobacter phage Urla]|uniref:Uncharacterized protein n=1 Tax=Arthrobacter phage Urla TaxID=2047867 RepID=A0A2H4P966_9CAUD|nr:hypothetical protein KDJ07_gp60 [Arthrobacter phage Urla]ATW58774.1 hypothetical protein PHIRE_URLA_60 [Arthrobacter phage Urla]
MEDKRTMNGKPEAGTRPVLPHTFGRPNLFNMTRAEKREFAQSFRKRGRPYKVQAKGRR